MYKTYRTTGNTIMADEVENADITLKLITDLDRKEYVMVKRQEGVLIYNLSLVGRVTEIVDDVSFEEYRKITYERLDKEALAQGIKPRRRLWSYRSME
jgi:H2-forming N5,N10-methylenetetrahydromethanopterin dehydrogenase-like enzyme